MVQKNATATELEMSVPKAQQVLDVAVQILYLCEGHAARRAACASDGTVEQADGLHRPHDCTNMQQLRHLQRRVNECLYNASLADTLDCTRNRQEALRAAKGKLGEVLSRAAGDAAELPASLHARVLKLLGVVLMKLDQAHDAAAMYDLFRTACMQSPYGV